MSEFVTKEKKKENRVGIPTRFKMRMEQSTGLSFDDVRVHYDPDSLAKASAIHSSGVAINTDAVLEKRADEIGAGKRIGIMQKMGDGIVQKCPPEPNGADNLYRVNIPEKIQKKVATFDAVPMDNYNRVIAALRRMNKAELSSLNSHKLKGEKGLFAIDIWGFGRGRGQGRLIYEIKDKEINVVKILEDHKY